MKETEGRNPGVSGGRDQGPFPNLFQPIQIGPLRLKNRIVMPPMSTNLADPQRPGFVSDRHKSYYGARAQGGTALIITESVNVNPTRPSRKFGLGLYDDRFIPGFRELAEWVKENGACCAVQLNNAGRLGPLKVDFEGKPDRSALKAGQYFAASPGLHPTLGIAAQEFTTRQLEEIAGYFADAAHRAKMAGFDAVELHAAHGYLLSEFLSPYTNKRKDQYGGDIEGRSRFPLQVVGRVREKLGSKMVLSYRMSAVEFVSGGLDLQDSKAFARKLEEAGVQIIHVSAGLNETLASMNRVIPPMSVPRGRLIQYAEEIKKTVKIPVIAVQRINTPELAEEVIREGKADLVATGRALIADPFWPLKAKEGRIDEIRRCIACNQGCMERIVMENSLSCLYNPEVGYEDQYRLKRGAEKRKKVLVVGGGIAGMEAAYVLASKGHKIRLIEREEQIGGTARAGSTLKEKEEFRGVIEFLQTQLKKLNVEIKCKEGFDIESLKDKSFDEILIAIGSVPRMPKISGPLKYQVRLAKETLINPEGVGKEVFILGGGSVGIEVAENLLRMGKTITVIEMLDKVCADLGPLNRVNVLERIQGSSLRLILRTQVLELVDRGVVVSREGKEEVLQAPDTVIIAMGGTPHPLPLPGSDSRVHYIGDCQKVGNAMDAIHDAFRTAVEL